MIHHFSGRAAILIHGSLGLLAFAYMLSGQVGHLNDISAARRLQVTDEEKQEILDEQMRTASRISMTFSSAFFFALSMWLMTHLTEVNLGLVQRSTMRKRLDFCLSLCLYITFFSALFNAVQLMDEDNLMIGTVDQEQAVIDTGRIVEWLLTCPLIQLSIPILAGEKVPDSRRVTMPTCAFTLLLLGLFSTLTSNIIWKALMFSASSLVMMAMLYLVNQCLVDASDGGECLFYGTSFLRGLSVLICLTWIPFPVWYALSAEGFNIIKDEPAMKVAVSFLNLFAKGAFILYVTRIRSDYHMREKCMVSAGYMTKDRTTAEEDCMKRPSKDGDATMAKSTRSMIEDMLDTMGRANDKTYVLELFSAHLITNNTDVLALTKEYCDNINLPWGLVIALKAKIRQNSVQLDDPWSMQRGLGEQNIEVEPYMMFSAPHITKNQKKLESLKKKSSYRHDVDNRDNISEMSTQDQRTPRLPQHDTNQYPSSNHSVDAGQAEMIETRLNAQVSECKEFVMNSMDKIMDVLERRLNETQQSDNTQLQKPGVLHASQFPQPTSRASDFPVERP